MEDLRDIRKQLRLAMNGVISTSMRQKGMNYKLIFGVPIPEIKHIAAAHEPDVELARALWKEDVREMKILATLLFPAGSMTQEEALAWMREIPYPEIAEQCCNNLFPTVEQPDQLALKFLADKKSPFGRMCGFLLWAQLFKKNLAVEKSRVEAFLAECTCTIHPDVEAGATESSWQEKQAAVQALKFFGRLSSANAQDALSVIAEDGQPETEELKAYYDDLQFEFAYYEEK
ncbi:DNA alkylation repair protein [Parabacteroides sp. AGMB00274]|uniref:DNA alkylation repair protein n=1 Tax=Parabacteroides faecalis TaxID=2924040 RepID=A0ABT0C1K9_9BACT|nr:DNA alkylation repair protein [Parabacteroides faecalis]MCI7287061.1 DNA alkylation repair protein [Parabacteroides sp.]MCJ2380918.1 DNA alkylation repair protein [Parabacteroides faecalis]MDY6253631.1 DNA alkylation repair protein [Bacteroidales bacterium]